MGIAARNIGDENATDQEYWQWAAFVSSAVQTLTARCVSLFATITRQFRRMPESRFIPAFAGMAVWGIGKVA